MKLSKRKKIKFILSTVLSLVFAFYAKNSYALDCNLDAVPGTPAPLPSQILCPLVRVVNLGLILSGVALVVFIGYGAIRLAVSLGDPKGYEASMRAFLFAVIGFFIVVGAFSILFLLNKTFGLGLGYDSANSLTENIELWWKEFLRGFLNLSEETAI
jgi:hypothetical protein